MGFEVLPPEVAAQVDAATESTPLADLVKIAVALAQARAVGRNTFTAAGKIAGLIGPKMSEDPLKVLVGLKQAQTAGHTSGAGVFTLLAGLDGGELEDWLDEPINLEAFAGGMEDAVAVLANPAIVQVLGTLVVGWETAIGADPGAVTEYAGQAEAHRRIAVAYQALAAGVEFWDDPGDTHTGLVAVMAAAKNKQLTGDPATMAAAVAELSKGLEPMLNDPDTVATLGGNQEMMSAWMDSYAIMGAVWNSDTATKGLLKSDIFLAELVKSQAGGEARVGFVILLDDNTAWLSLLANDQAWGQVLANDQRWGQVLANDQRWGQVLANDQAWGQVLANDQAWKGIWAVEKAINAMMNNSKAIEKLYSSPLKKRITKNGSGWQGKAPVSDHVVLVTGRGIFLQRYENYSYGYPGNDGIDIDGVIVAGSTINNFRKVLRYTKRIGIAWYESGSWLDYIPA